MCFASSLDTVESTLLSLSGDTTRGDKLDGKVIKVTVRLICQNFNMLIQWVLSTTKEPQMYQKTEKLIFTGLNIRPTGKACFQ